MSNVHNEEKAVAAAQLAIASTNQLGRKIPDEKKPDVQIRSAFKHFLEQLQDPESFPFGDDAKIRVAALLVAAAVNTGDASEVLGIFKHYLKFIDETLPEPEGQVFP